LAEFDTFRIGGVGFRISMFHWLSVFLSLYAYFKWDDNLGTHA